MYNELCTMCTIIVYKYIYDLQFRNGRSRLYVQCMSQTSKQNKQKKTLSPVSRKQLSLANHSLVMYLFKLYSEIFGTFILQCL